MGKNRGGCGRADSACFIIPEIGDTYLIVNNLLPLGSTPFPATKIAANFAAISFY